MDDSRSTSGYRWQMTGVGEPLVRVRFALPAPGPGEALVRVAGCGVCHTDLGYLFDGVKTRGSLPLALGHEVSGVVEAAGAGFAPLVGRAVIVPAVTPCGQCPACRTGYGSICATQTMPGNDVQGGFASHLVVPARGLCVLDGEPGLLEGGTFGDSGCTLAELAVIADAVTTPYQAMHRAHVKERDLVVVIGLGGVGGFAALIGRALGATVVGFDIDGRRREMLSAHGVAKVIDPSGREARDLKNEVRAFAKDAGAPAVCWKIFECSGSAAGQDLAWNMLGPGAYLSVVGFTMAKLEVRLSNLMAFDAKAAGNWGCLPEHYPGAVRLCRDGKVPLKPFVETYPLDRIQEVMTMVREHRVSRRPVLIP
ncbi:MAG: 6-hydroxycyclohex-1-ene-1-carbonyl-CoA dehydrogenase [Planctomycetota bacterium]